ncbi:hypothetical protein BLNAU_15134 [Blattamonas nauphoetae]|uniref:Uncharacterized protein n=1 Tax=Blattamonas nauphoetae TaxID=2049346 RepID=A0ABQ9XFA2_9EUKA|nr:hypothetical protein BLNAU_15134 [Blattamonas nauphoetae]
MLKRPRTFLRLNISQQTLQTLAKPPTHSVLPDPQHLRTAEADDDPTTRNIPPSRSQPIHCLDFPPPISLPAHPLSYSLTRARSGGSVAFSVSPTNNGRPCTPQASHVPQTSDVPIASNPPSPPAHIHQPVRPGLPAPHIPRSGCSSRKHSRPSPLRRPGPPSPSITPFSNASEINVDGEIFTHRVQLDLEHEMWIGSIIIVRDSASQTQHRATKMEEQRREFRKGQTSFELDSIFVCSTSPLSDLTVAPDEFDEVVFPEEFNRISDAGQGSTATLPQKKLPLLLDTGVANCGESSVDTTCGVGCDTHSRRAISAMSEWKKGGLGRWTVSSTSSLPSNDESGLTFLFFSEISPSFPLASAPVQPEVCLLLHSPSSPTLSTDAVSIQTTLHLALFRSLRTQTNPTRSRLQHPPPNLRTTTTLLYSAPTKQGPRSLPIHSRPLRSLPSILAVAPLPTPSAPNSASREKGWGNDCSDERCSLASSASASSLPVPSSSPHNSEIDGGVWMSDAEGKRGQFCPFSDPSKSPNDGEEYNAMAFDARCASA